MTENKFINFSDNHIGALSRELDKEISKETFCILPFSHLSTTTTGEIRLCCRSKKVSDIQQSDIREVWDSEKLNQVREDLVNGVKIEECKKCWDLERRGIASLRQGQNIARTQKYKNNVKSFFSGEDLILPTLELKLSNRCNLKCKMCSPAASTRWVKDWQHLKNHYEKNYQNWIDKVISSNNLMSNPSLDMFMASTKFINDFKLFAKEIDMLDFAGGEPLLDPLHYQVLEHVISYGNPENTILRYSTNLTRLNFESFNVLELWSRFKEVHLTISIDGDRKMNEYIRVGTSSIEFEKNLEKVRKLEKVKRIKGTTTISAHNALVLDKVVSYIVNTLGLSLHTSRVLDPSFLDARILPQKLREESVKKVLNIEVDKSNLTKDEIVQYDRHVADFSSWMSEKVEFNQELFRRFVEFTESSDKVDGVNYFSLLREYGIKL